MSAVCILTPVVIAAWPAFSAAVIAAATSLGYTVAKGAIGDSFSTSSAMTADRVELQMNQSELVTDQLGRDQRISVTRNGVTVTFSRDARGKASLCVTGPGKDEKTLRALGEELSRRVVQKFVYQRLMEEMKARKFLVVGEEIDSTQAIHLKVRHWES